MTQQDLIEGGSQPMVAQANPLAMVQAALERGMDAETIGKFMELAERHEANQARKAYVRAMNEFKSEPLQVSRTKNVKFKNKTGGVTNYNHAELDRILDTATPRLSACGFACSWKPSNLDDGRVQVECVMTHKDGHSESVTLSAMPDASGGKNPVQGIGSTVKYLERYTFMAIIGAAERNGDDDGGAAGQESDLIDPATQADIDALVDEVLKTPEQRVNFSGWLKTKIGAANGFVRNIPSAKAAEVVAMLEKKRAAS